MSLVEGEDSFDCQDLIEKSKALRARSDEAIRRSAELREKFRNLEERSYTAIYSVNICNSIGCIMKTCSRCKAVYKPSEWLKLTLCGHTVINGVGGELRHCPCGNTLTVITRRQSTL
jgi:hypothetical protein